MRLGVQICPEVLLNTILATYLQGRYVVCSFGIPLRYIDMYRFDRFVGSCLLFYVFLHQAKHKKALTSSRQLTGHVSNQPFFPATCSSH